MTKKDDFINGISLFTNVGIDEHYFSQNNINIKVANELLQDRCDFYSHLYPSSKMICGDINVHPGRRSSDGTYSDARVLSVLELIRLTGLPDNWDIPVWANDGLIRKVIGESFPPRFAESLLQTIPTKELQ